MAKILILGGTGYTGKLIAKHLLDQSDASITLATRHPEKSLKFSDELNAQYPGNRVAAVYANAADADSLREAFPGHAMVVVAAPTAAYTENVVRIALETGIDYLDVQLSTRKFALLQSYSDEIESTGRCFITEAGFHPGLPSALVRFAAKNMDIIETAITAGYLNMVNDLPYSDAVDELIEYFKEYKAQVYQDGQWTKPESFKMIKFDFGSDIGKKTCYSMYFEELRPLPDLFPSLKEPGFYMSESHWVTDWLIMPVTWFGLKLFPNAVKSFGKFLWWGMGTFNKPPARVELQVQSEGVRDGQRVKFIAVASHPDGYQLTAIPVVATLLQYLDGSNRKPGLWMMGHFSDPVRLMEDLKKMGIRFFYELTGI